jgi:hypothetical protein
VLAGDGFGVAWCHHDGFGVPLAPGAGVDDEDLLIVDLPVLVSFLAWWAPAELAADWHMYLPAFVLP